MSNMSRTAKKSLKQESKTVYWTPPLSSETSESFSTTVTPQAIRGWLTSLQLGSPASRSPLPENDRGKTMNAICGLPQSASFAQYDLNTHCWKTSQASLLTNTWEEFSGTWPRAGIASDGHVWEQMTLELTTEESGYGFLPTPIRQDSKLYDLRLFYQRKKPHSIGTLSEYLSMKGLRITPEFSEGMMGWPLGMTDLRQLEMDKFLSAWLTPFRSYLKELLNRKES